METSEVKYPEVIVTLIGSDGNAFAILGKVTRAMKRKGLPQRECQAFMDEAMTGDYDALLQTVMRWVTVE